jgi:hypothetical protein
VTHHTEVQLTIDSCEHSIAYAGTSTQHLGPIDTELWDEDTKTERVPQITMAMESAEVPGERRTAGPKTTLRPRLVSSSCGSYQHTSHG